MYLVYSVTHLPGLHHVEGGVDVQVQVNVNVNVNVNVRDEGSRHARRADVDGVDDA